MKVTVSKAIGQALHEELARDQNVILLGEDVGVMGNVFAITAGFRDEFGPDRVIDTPISESGFTGIAVGAAMRGLRPVVEWMYNDFISVCLDPVMNQAAKLRYMTGGQVKVPVVFRAPMGAGRRNAGQHSQCLEALFTHIPGLKVVCPSTAADAKGLLKAAIRDDDPVVFLEHKLLYARKEEIPDGEYVIPLGKADIKRPGKDITILTWSRQVLFSLEAAEALAMEGIDAEVLDLRTLVPLDWEMVRDSVCKTHNAVVVEEGVKRGGVGAELSAQMMEELFDELDSPVGRVAGMNVVSPFSPVLEDAQFPHPKDIVAGVKKTLGR
ncbi:alpha-ketoacid dehydrogenase subunit beta [Oscillibacter sp.]|uniref:alpha-ketoacid dehydrogenase subunit beta n=1 Tax=Oscillibacter sp. TaxID=1945593 RepID=UPI0028B04070|nr:alpha-ketoacid dehydrogenase subunit beta [Oscillibacter sp.]